MPDFPTIRAAKEEAAASLVPARKIALDPNFRPIAPGRGQQWPTRAEVEAADLGQLQLWFTTLDGTVFRTDFIKRHVADTIARIGERIEELERITNDAKAQVGKLFDQ